MDEQPYQLRFDFDVEGEPPTVLIWADDVGDVVEVFEEPKQLSKEWSWDADDWEAGPLAQQILDALNA